MVIVKKKIFQIGDRSLFGKKLRETSMVIRLEDQRYQINKKENLTKNEPDKQHTTDTSEGMAYGITRGSGKPSGQMAAFGKKKGDKKENPYSLKIN